MSMYDVYLVDDDRLILEEITDIVPWSEYDFELIGSNTDPEAAFDEILKLSPDVVFCDLKMPVMDGNELIRRLKEAGCKAEFVMLSAYDSYDSVRAFYKQAGYDYLLKPVDVEETRMVLEGLYVRLLELKPDENDADVMNVAGNADGFDKLLTYIDNNFGERLSLDSLSKQFGFSRNYICKLFSNNLGTTLMHHVLDIRMKHAAQMLKDSTIPIKEIAIMCGYVNTVYFYRVFKEYYGVTAKEYRDGAGD